MKCTAITAKGYRCKRAAGEAKVCSTHTHAALQHLARAHGAVGDIDVTGLLTTPLCGVTGQCTFTFRDAANVWCIVRESGDCGLDPLFAGGECKSYEIMDTGICLVKHHIMDAVAKFELWNNLVMELTSKCLRIPEIAVVFDLEWSEHRFRYRFVTGKIVDHHFEVCGYPLVVSTGVVRQTGELTDFLLSQGFTREMVETSPLTMTDFRENLEILNRVAVRAVFSAYNGMGADLKVLEYNGIIIREYVDSMMLFTPQARIKLVDLHRRVCGTDPGQTHWAEADTRMVLDVLRALKQGPRTLFNFIDFANENSIDLSPGELFNVYNPPCAKPHEHIVCTGLVPCVV